MKLAHRYGLIAPRLDVCGLIGMVLGIIFTIALVWSLGVQAAYWAVGFLP